MSRDNFLVLYIVEIRPHPLLMRLICSPTTVRRSKMAVDVRRQAKWSYNVRRAIFYYDIHCGPLWYIVVVHCGTLWYIVVHCGTLWYIVVHCGTLWYIAVHCGTLWSIVVHCGTLWYIVVHCGTLWYIVGFSRTPLKMLKY